MLDLDPLTLPLKMQAELLSLSRSSLYYHAAKPSLEEVTMKNRIEEIYTRWPFYGSCKIAVLLNQE